MSEQTGIEWCDHTFNIAWGCMKVSPGCKHCYADTWARRYPMKVDGKAVPVWGPPETTARRTFGAKHWNDPLKWDRAAEREGVRRRVFCSSMCDVFEDHPTIDAEREKLWPLIRATPHLDWLLLTKRPERIAEHLPDDWGPARYGNVWLGTSVESQDYMGRVDALLQVPAAIRFVSFEPLLGPIDLPAWWADEVDWSIVGGESGARCRSDDAHVERLGRALIATGACWLFKQWGGHPNKRGGELAVLDGARHLAWPESTTKAAA